MDRLTDLIEQEAASQRPAEEMLDAWCRRCSSTSPKGCATMPRCCWCSGPAVLREIWMRADEKMKAVIMRQWGRRTDAYGYGAEAGRR